MTSTDLNPQSATRPAPPPSEDLVHQLNNVLTVVLGSLEQLHRQPLNERGKAQLERAQWGVAQAGDLVRQVIGGI